MIKLIITGKDQDQDVIGFEPTVAGHRGALVEQAKHESRPSVVSTKIVGIPQDI